ncbi:DNA-binding CsgD family transcriptional regulator/tetratricopeptide (TPR) repeat protein/energy-coupling factor transporter ATP-binding protein EcfA2 [Allocatelliglobosispora scoriae]|uniref:DNA-binding CsgD family transcriptional regulator/tetratricopeptide (TPR) repeat protein/energy-coupling factor transporter ATP-binding protein EcfA2 n=1 Tax=Allocatelliglobosispora scoriae TaxID=643052 RepID=A0A841C4V3_9ACTN|nr:helix-turn-helix transcriptional regulator [Allocatelliglobosispora scoriae]MBB5874173.1 DNA-binding CsgD family transcriptional regulator/tetratricopeptide (TPR) repeat protein/energy-coupling factor transporter ATP-binding protein EcfA2 [Allocatelliglobosispora scoriae]
MIAVKVAGRDELAAEALAHKASGRHVVLIGATGVGKSTVLRALADQVAAEGELVLRAAPVEADARLPFVTLIDLLGGVPDAVLARMGASSRRIAELALRRRDPAGGPVDTLAVCLAMLELLRLTGEAGPTLLCIDDLQWIDPASAEVLTFVIRRLPAGGVTVLGAERVLPGHGRRGPQLAGAAELEVGPLPEEVLIQAVLDRVGGLVGRPIARRICLLSGGNPLFALEIADGIRRGGVRPVLDQPLPVPLHLDALMRQRLAVLSAPALQLVRVAAVAHRATLDTLTRADCPDVVASLTEASAAGVCDLGTDGSVSFGHPLLRAAVYAEAPAIVRMSLHARLVEAVDDPIERARHLALATARADATVAAALTTAATLAAGRGAAGVARELSGLAALRTPAANVEDWAERKLAEARYAHRAGLPEEAIEAADAVLAAEVPRDTRVRARLVAFESAGDWIGRMGDQVTAALTEARGDSVLEPQVRVHLARYYAMGLRSGEALAEALAAASAAAAVGDHRTELLALHVVLTAQSRLGQPREEILARAWRLIGEHPGLGESAPMVTYEVAWDDYEADRWDAAYSTLAGAVITADEAGVVGSLEPVLCLMAVIDLRRGRTAQAQAALARVQQISAYAELASRDRYLIVAALAESISGSVPRALSLAQAAVEEAESIGSAGRLITYCHLLGALRLCSGDVTGAAETLSQARLHAAGRVHTNETTRLLADLIEALVRVGQLDEARQIMPELRGRTPVGGEPVNRALGSACASALRAEAHLAFAEGQAEQAAALLTQAAEVYRGLGAPVELVRVLLAAADVQRRGRRRATARKLLEEARSLCVEAGASVWLSRVEAELARLAPVRDGVSTLTPMEERIAALVVQGATNREIATSLHIAVTTVEGSLTQIYRRLGLRSRVELARALGSGQ